MHPEYRKWLAVCYVAAGGIVVAVATIATVLCLRKLSMYNPDTMGNVAFSFFCGSLATTVLGGVILPKFYTGEVRLIRNWRKKTSLRVSDFPLDEGERQALQSGWLVADVLCRVANKATGVYAVRDAALDSLRAVEKELPSLALPPVNASGFLKQKRRENASAQKVYDKKLHKARRKRDTAVQLADAISERSKDLWGIFASVNILPINPETGKPWDDQNKFRLSLVKTPDASGVGVRVL